MIRRLAIVGTGLIGASVGLAAKRVGIESVAGFDVDADALAVARRRGAVDETPDALAAALDGADLAVVAAPVATLPDQVDAVLEASDAGCTVTDVGSTERSVVAATEGSGRFIGGHPVCGREARGPAHATAELFEGAAWVLTPVASTEPARYRTLHGFVSSVGAVPVAIEAEAHDRLVALTSHLPHVLANLLVN